MLDKSALYAQKPDEQEQRIARQQLQQVVAYCESDICRRRVLLAYFGETLQGENCGNCDTHDKSGCYSSTPLEDRTSDAQKFLLCIARTQDTHDKSGCYGMRHIIDILRGANTQKIRDYGHDQQSHDPELLRTQANESSLISPTAAAGRDHQTQPTVLARI